MMCCKTKLCNLKALPLWMRSGLLVGGVMTLIFTFLPERLTNLASSPAYLQWILIPVFMIFAHLCIFFRVDFVSNHSPQEGPWRNIFLTSFGWVSYFIVFFIIGSIIGAVISLLRKKRSKRAI